ncbi:MAG: zinc ribbon domain-containing protein [Bacilli bacterium]|nr:zinc ribbon domain-containing protein [Bacilli bacterium]
MKCINCGFNNSDSSKFCASCGLKLEKPEYNPNTNTFKCSCGVDVLEGSKFCPRCGTKFNVVNLQPDNKKSNNKREQDFLYLILAFIIPIFGICYFFIGRKNDKKVAFLALIIGIFSIVVRCIYYIVCFGLSLLE